MAVDITALPEVAQRIVAEITQHRKVFAIPLFGSWARGEQMPVPDILRRFCVEKCSKHQLLQRRR